MELGGIQGSKSDKVYSIAEHVDTSINKTKESKYDKKKTSSNINASDLNLGTVKDSNLKELFGKKNAKKLQLDQFDKDLEMDDTIKSHAERRDLLLKEAGTNQSDVSRLKKLKKDLKEANGIEDDSEEQKDLELLEKQITDPKKLSAEDKERIKNIGPLSDYQKASLEFTSMSQVFQKRADTARNDSVNENRTITAIKLELLKDEPMLKAKKEAEDVLSKVDEDIQKAVLDELKQRVNDKIDVKTTEQILTDPQNFIDQKKITEEDIKGLAVDEKV